MRFTLLPITGFAVLAIATAAIVIGINGTSPVHGGSSKRESIVSAASPSAASHTGGSNVEENALPADSFVSRQRRSRSLESSVTHRPSEPRAVDSQPASPEAILAALRAAGPTTLSALRPIDFPSAATPSAGSSDLITVNPDAPGNRLTTDEQTITVEAYQPVPAGNELTIHITPSSQGARSDFRSGFTHEEEQFRAKWGWAAFDQTQRIAKSASSETR